MKMPSSTILSEKLIKPSSPTPSTQRWHKLSLLDQAFSNIYIPFAFFYTKKQLDSVSINPTQISHLLENSLSKLLVSYYPYAGRLKDNTIVDCNDVGADFLRVEINIPISQALQKHNNVIEEMVFPRDLPWSNCTNRGLVVAQLSYFNCGGIAISLCISHKVGDGHSSYNLFHDWAKITREPNGPKPVLQYVQESIFPPPITGTPFLSPVCTSNKEDCIQRKFIFPIQKLNKLKALIAATSNVQNPTRNEVVSALIFKCIVAAVKVVNSGKSFQPWIMSQSFDLRHQIDLPPNSIGNILTSTYISIAAEKYMTLANIVTEMRKEKQRVCDRDNVEDNLFLKKFLELATEEKNFLKVQNNMCNFSSLVKFPVHEIDFGWGKPAKVNIANGLHNKVVFLVGNLSGVDAFVSLSAKVMSVFEKEKELLEFAAAVPTF
ncbi:acyltransferase Pun1-like [Nicotiana tomentosiformis]|uniref:acyltransferase Pun1-like n=1 Tax=Nicotiana tomentosiformis TaxID=4098 RepID=UPI00051AB9F2|nr:acylsugar acyltransferase 3-like [Nicotiana tomentosiformis]XP_016490033.1 PREDICTED: acylsugar acyltransferase 3-like [Nicotiana tabacum]